MRKRGIKYLQHSTSLYHCTCFMIIYKVKCFSLTISAGLNGNIDNLVSSSPELSGTLKLKNSTKSDKQGWDYLLVNTYPIADMVLLLRYLSLGREIVFYPHVIFINYLIN